MLISSQRSGLGATPYTGVQVTDPAVIAQLQQSAVTNGYDPSLVTQMISGGADAVQIQLALMGAPNGPAQLASQLETQDEIGTMDAQLYGGSSSANVGTLPPVDPNAIPSWLWYAAAAGVALILLGKL